MKLFNLGLPKSGTTSVQKALATAGVRSAHWYMRDSKRFVGSSMYRNHFMGHDPLADLAQYDAVTQADLVTNRRSFWPQMDLAILRAVRVHHPECVFLMLTRDPAKILNSISNWYDLRMRLIRLGAPGLPPRAAQSDGAIIAWIEGHYRNMRACFRDDPRFAEIDIEDADIQQRLSEIVGKELNWWGQINTSPAIRKRVA